MARPLVIITESILSRSSQRRTERLPGVYQFQKRVGVAIDRATDPQAAGGVKVFKLKISYGVVHGFHLFERLKPLL